MSVPESGLHLTRARVALGCPPASERGATAEYLLHQAIADLFGDRDDRGYLWRELQSDGLAADVLVLSAAAPDPNAGPAMPAHRRVTSLVTRPFRPELVVGQRLDFELRVNATRVVTTAGVDDLMAVTEGPRKRRYDVWDVVFSDGPRAEVRMADVYAAWLRERLSDVADVGEVAVTERRALRVRRSVRQAPVTVIATNLVGELTVRDPHRLASRMGAGIGRARAFGCGLLCLAPLGTRPRRARILEEPRQQAVAGSSCHHGDG
jgi:CRISPR system Cascade subunit CasE